MGEVLRKIPRHQRFSVGDLLIHHNQWAGWDKPKDSAPWFNAPLSYDECCKLQPGDEVWMDDEPYRHAGGKVYGRMLIEVTKVEQVADGVKVHYGATSFTTVYKNRSSFTFAILTNEQKVWDDTKNEHWARTC